MNIKEAYTYDDVLLVPQYSSLVSRKDVDLSVDLGKGVVLKTPIVSANMSDVTEWKMAEKISALGGLSIIHRFNTIEEQVMQFSKAYNEDLYNRVHMDILSGEQINIGCAVGIQEEDKKRVEELVKVGCQIICVDVAHAHHEKTGEFVSWVSANFPDVLLIAGNVATREGAEFLASYGADVIKVGIGGGSICTTRVETGNGVPNLTALDEIHSIRKDKFESYHGGFYTQKIKSKHQFKIIADGGIRKAGDMVKALCFADAVMVGNLLAGTDETPGEKVNVNGVLYKAYNGSSTHKTDHVEGVKAYVPYKGPVANVIKSLEDGLRSGCSYQGARNLQELKENPQFVKVTNAGLIESRHHDVVVRE